MKTPNKSMRKRQASSFKNEQVAKITEQATQTGKRNRVANTQQQAEWLNNKHANLLNSHVKQV